MHARDGVTWPRQTAPRRAPLDRRELGEALTVALGVVPPAATGLPGILDPAQPATTDCVPVDVLLPPGTASRKYVRPSRRLDAPDAAGRLTRATSMRLAGRPRQSRRCIRSDADVFALDRTGERRAPLALWLGPLCRASGHTSPLEEGAGVPERLVADGWAVACFDPIGTGTRRGEEAGFRRRYPGWSLLGRMVHDARAAIAAAATLPEVDATAPWVVGYGVGGLVGLHLAALEPIVGGVAVAAPSAADLPLLAAEPWHGLTDLLCALGTRPALVVSPLYDPEADAEDTGDAVRAAAGERARVEHAVVRDHHRLSEDTRALLCAWVGERAARTRHLAA